MTGLGPRRVRRRQNRLTRLQAFTLGFLLQAQGPNLVLYLGWLLVQVGWSWQVEEGPPVPDMHRYRPPGGPLYVESPYLDPKGKVIPPS